MKVEKLIEVMGSDFFVGVPDSQLKALCNYLMNNYGIDSNHHLISANEGNCVALAAGYHLATGKIPVVYLQNSGQGNIINPVASLLNEKVYSIPMIFIIGWRGEPGFQDEPQHIYQGEITLNLLKEMGIAYHIISKETTEEQIQEVMEGFKEELESGKDVAFVVRKDALSYEGKKKYTNHYRLNREEVLEHIVEVSKEDPIISTTGKISRELFEIRERTGQGHQYDFLTVGSMGHSNSIALGVALSKKNTKVWCIDGDGAVLMHMGGLAILGATNPPNMVHVLINNEAHETVGGMPTVASQIDFVTIAKACGYSYAVTVETFEDLDRELELAKNRDVLSFIEVKCSIGSRDDLGRPTTTALENKEKFMEYLRTL